jgi:hypothetical protein
MSSSPRQVFGPYYPNCGAPWWDPARAGQPLTPRTAYFLRRNMLSSTPGSVQKALAERGLLNAPRDTMTERWTPLGMRARAALGSVPREWWPRQAHDHFQVAPALGRVACGGCGKVVAAELVCWGVGSACVHCVTLEADDE